MKRLLLCAVLLFSCTSQSSTVETLELWALGREGEVVAELLPEFHKRHPDIRVTVQQIPWSAAHEKLLTAYVGESTPDIAQMGNTWIPEFAAVRALEDLSEFAKARLDQRDYFPGIWATNVVDGALYGVPWYVDTRVLFYRTDMLAAVGYPEAPRTWAQWLDAMEKIKTRRLARFGIVMPTNEWEQPVALAFSNGSGLLNAAGTRGAFREPQFAEAFAFYRSIFERGYAPVDSNQQIANLYQQFAQGDFAMLITGPWNIFEFRRRLPAHMEDKWSTAPLPGPNGIGVSTAGGSSLVVFRASKHKAAAQKLIEFLSEPARQVRFFELTGDLPARRSAWSAPAFAAEPRFPAFREQLESVRPLPQVPEWEQIATAIYDRGEAAVRGVVTVEQAVAQLDARADEVLEKRRWILSR
jgi:multiple sugar transport system substrate-binding protein